MVHYELHRNWQVLIQTTAETPNTAAKTQIPITSFLAVEASEVDVSDHGREISFIVAAVYTTYIGKFSASTRECISTSNDDDTIYSTPHYSLNLCDI